MSKPVNIVKQSQAAFNTGNGTATVTAAALTDNPWIAQMGVFIRNHDGANPMFVGIAGVTSTKGFRVDAGDDLWIPVSDPRTIYVIRSTADVAYSFLVV